MDNQSLAYKRAKRKVREIRSFYLNLTCYCTVIPVLIFINLYFTPEFYWFWFSALGWGTGLFFHAMEAFKWNPFFGKDWEQKKLQQFIEEERTRQNHFNQESNGEQS